MAIYNEDRVVSVVETVQESLEEGAIDEAADVLLDLSEDVDFVRAVAQLSDDDLDRLFQTDRFASGSTDRFDAVMDEHGPETVKELTEETDGEDNV